MVCLDFCVRGGGIAYSTSLMSGLTWSCGDSSVSAVDPDFVATGQKCGKKEQMFCLHFSKKLFENLLSYAASLNSSERAGGGFVE